MHRSRPVRVLAVHVRVLAVSVLLVSALLVVAGRGSLARPAAAGAIDPCSVYYCGTLTTSIRGDGRGTVFAGPNGELDCSYANGGTVPSPCFVQFAWPHSQGTVFVADFSMTGDPGSGVCSGTTECSPLNATVTGQIAVIAGQTENLTGSFWQEYFSVTVGVDGSTGGTAGFSDGAFGCTTASTCTVPGVPGGSAASITAVPAAGYVFDHWTGSCAGPTAACSYPLDGDSTSTAYFRTATATASHAPTPSRSASPGGTPKATIASSGGPAASASPGGPESGAPGGSAAESGPMPSAAASGPVATASPSPVAAVPNDGPLLFVVVALGILVVGLAIVIAFLLGRSRRAA